MREAVDALVRRAHAGDLLRVSALDQEVFGGYAYPFFVLRQLHSILPNGLLLAETDGNPIGYVLAGSGTGTRQGWVLSLGVTGPQRGRGVGELLLREALNGIRGTSDEALLTVEPENLGAVRLYERLGFSVAEDSPDYFGDGERRLLMRKPV